MGNRALQITDLDSLSIQQIEDILDMGRALKNKRFDCSQWMAGNILCPLFMQDSSRTYINSGTSFTRMGGTLLPLSISNTRFGSAWSEPVRDFCTLINAACDIAILRTPTASMLFEFQEWLDIPLINAGNGIGTGSEHPMQALIDLHVIRERVKPADVRILMVGGIHIRTTRSQAKLFHRYGFEIDIVAPPSDADNSDIVEFFEANTRAYDDIRCIDLSKYDVIYHNGMDEDHTVKTNDKYNISASTLISGGFSGKIMHSLPRLSELSHDIDDTEFNLYYAQMREARYVYQSMFNFLLPGPSTK